MPEGNVRIESPERYDIATEVLSSAVRVLQAAGFSEREIPKLFEQAAGSARRCLDRTIVTTRDVTPRDCASRT